MSASLGVDFLLTAGIGREQFHPAILTWNVENEKNITTWNRYLAAASSCSDRPERDGNPRFISRMRRRGAGMHERGAWRAFISTDGLVVVGAVMYPHHKVRAGGTSMG